MVTTDSSWPDSLLAAMTRCGLARTAGSLSDSCSSVNRRSVSASLRINGESMVFSDCWLMGFSSAKEKGSQTGMPVPALMLREQREGGHFDPMLVAQTRGYQPINRT